MDMVKQIFTVKSLSLGWSIFWRVFIAALVNGIAVAIVMYIAGLLGDAVSGIIGIVAAIYTLLFQFMALGWAAQRIKDKI
ncbi:MAG: hypothetical protein JW782_05450 [Candidatus Saganbacteria bacterium]|nr:hypothetical protein [Candidatus Saganbacteria bacterium]